MVDSSPVADLVSNVLCCLLVGCCWAPAVTDLILIETSLFLCWDSTVASVLSTLAHCLPNIIQAAGTQDHQHITDCGLYQQIVVTHTRLQG